MHRSGLAIAAIALFAGGVAIYSWHAGGGAVLMRAGAACGVLWLAYPQLEQIPKTWWVGILLVAISLVVRPRYAPLMLVVLIAIAILRPKRNRTSAKLERSRR